VACDRHSTCPAGCCTYGIRNMCLVWHGCPADGTTCWLLLWFWSNRFSFLHFGSRFLLLWMWSKIDYYFPAFSVSALQYHCRTFYDYALGYLQFGF
jgi:hypothetical protein